MTTAAPLELHRGRVLPEWIDYNGHMNVAFYILAFDHATDAFFDYLGLDSVYRERTGQSTFAVEGHVTYQREVMEGDPLRFTTQLLGYDDKRLHFLHHMFHADEGFLAATVEWLSLHVDLERRRVAPMPPVIREALAQVWASHRSLPVPDVVGKVIDPPRPR